MSDYFFLAQSLRLYYIVVVVILEARLCIYTGTCFSSVKPWTWIHKRTFVCRHFFSFHKRLYFLEKPGCWSITLVLTIHRQTSLSIHSVQLLGSWDNFSTRYPMERDLRRGKDQWRGCYSFKDIICDGDGAGSPKRNGGLKMGQEYWYYVSLLIFSWGFHLTRIV